MRSEKQKLANYTELVHAGEGVTIEKGVISAPGSGGSGGVRVTIIDGATVEYDEDEGYYRLNFNTITWEQIFNALNTSIVYLRIKSDNRTSYIHITDALYNETFNRPYIVFFELSEYFKNDALGLGMTVTNASSETNNGALVV